MVRIDPRPMDGTSDDASCVDRMHACTRVPSLLLADRETSKMSLHALYCDLIDLPAEARWRHIEQLNLAEADRAALISLLLAGDGPDLLTLPIEQVVAALRSDELAAADFIGRIIGTFRITEFIGEGGFSLVFRAVRPAGDGQQTVAMKLLRGGRARHADERLFRREQAILAQLSHPNIARLVEAGIDPSGLTYLAMEHVDGQPITSAADLRSLGLQERLELFLQLCAAVIAAHASLVVHCDLKPSNVIVDQSGHLKVLDFGIAQLLEDGEQQSLGIALTPQYAAPEQFRRAPPAAAFDVYALGVILVELLTGQRNGGLASARAAALDPAQVPRGLPAPRRLARQLRGDIDAIVATAIAQDAAQRYSSVAAFAQDIRNVLNCRPVSVREHRLGYRTLKFIQRYRTGVAITSLLFAALLLSLGFAAWQALVATRAAAEARAQTVRANAMRDMVFDVFAEAEPGAARSGPVTVVDALEHAIASLATRELDPRTRVEVMTRFADSLGHQGHPERALKLLAGISDEATQLFGEWDPLTTHAVERLAFHEISIGRYEPAKARIDRLLEAAPAADVEFRTKVLARSSVIGWRTNDPGRAIRDGRKAVELARATGSRSLLRAILASFTAALLGIGEVEQATVALEEQVALAKAEYGPVHKEVAGAYAGLSRAYRRLGHMDKAEAAIQQALTIDASVFPDEHPFVANHYNALSMIQIARRDFHAALAASRKQAAITLKFFGPDHTDSINGQYSIGMVHVYLEEYRAALPYLQEALARYTRNFGAEDARTRFAETGYGLALAMSGDYRRGAELLERSIAGLLALRYAHNDFAAKSVEKRIRIALHVQDIAAATAWLARLDEAMQLIPAAESRAWPVRAAVLTASVRLAEGKPEAALDALARSPASSSTDGDPAIAAEWQLLLAAAQADIGDAQAARQALSAGDALLERLPAAPSALKAMAASLRLRLQ